jgi:hypothetical protein
MAKKKPDQKKASLVRTVQKIVPIKNPLAPSEYDRIGFKNSQIDALKGKMDKFATDYSAENRDIATNLPASFISGTKPEKKGRDVWQGGSKQWFEPNKRNQLIEDVYEAKGPLTGKKGMSISKYLKNRSTLRSYYTDENLDTNKKSGN